MTMASFKLAISRGRRFERRERGSWMRLDSGTSSGEAATTLNGRRGRIDIRVDEVEGYVSIIELKATDWDGLDGYRVRSTALRHARQVWRYTRAELERGLDVCAGVIYEREPTKLSVREVVEEALNERSIQVVWRAPAIAAQHALHQTAGGAILRGRW